MRVIKKLKLDKMQQTCEVLYDTSEEACFKLSIAFLKKNAIISLHSYLPFYFALISLELHRWLFQLSTSEDNWGYVAYQWSSVSLEMLCAYVPMPL